MKTVTLTFAPRKECKHSVVYEPITATTPDKPPFATGIYISRASIPSGARECKITLSWPDGGQDNAYNAIQ